MGEISNKKKKFLKKVRYELTKNARFEISEENLCKEFGYREIESHVYGDLCDVIRGTGLDFNFRRDENGKRIYNIFDMPVIMGFFLWEESYNDLHELIDFLEENFGRLDNIDVQDWLQEHISKSRIILDSAGRIV